MRNHPAWLRSVPGKLVRQECPQPRYAFMHAAVAENVCRHTPAHGWVNDMQELHTEFELPCECSSETVVGLQNIAVELRRAILFPGVQDCTPAIDGDGDRTHENPQLDPWLRDFVRDWLKDSAAVPPPDADGPRDGVSRSPRCRAALRTRRRPRTGASRRCRMTSPPPPRSATTPTARTTASTGARPARSARTGACSARCAICWCPTAA